MSVNAVPVIAVALAFESVIVSTDVPPMPMADGANDLAIVGWASTVHVELAPAGVPEFVVVSLPVLFRYDPALALVTLTVTVHEPLAGTVAPERAALTPL